MNDEAVRETAQDWAEEWLEEVIDHLPRFRSLEATRLEVAKELKMKPIERGVRRIRAIQAGDAGSDTLVQFWVRYRVWKDRVMERERAKAQREYKRASSLGINLEHSVEGHYSREDR